MAEKRCRAPTAFTLLQGPIADKNLVSCECEPRDVSRVPCAPIRSYDFYHSTLGYCVTTRCFG